MMGACSGGTLLLQLLASPSAVLTLLLQDPLKLLLHDRCSRLSDVSRPALAEVGCGVPHLGPQSSGAVCICLQHRLQPSAYRPIYKAGAGSSQLCHVEYAVIGVQEVDKVKGGSHWEKDSWNHEEKHEKD